MKTSFNAVDFLNEILYFLFLPKSTGKKNNQKPSNKLKRYSYFQPEFLSFTLYP